MCNDIFFHVRFIFNFVYTVTDYRKKRDVTPTNRADMHTATSLPIRILNLHGPIVSGNRQREKTYSVGEKDLKHSIFWGVGPCRLVSTAVTSTVLA